METCFSSHPDYWSAFYNEIATASKSQIDLRARRLRALNGVVGSRVRVREAVLNLRSAAGALTAANKVEEWERMVNVNIKGVLYGIAAALPRFQAQNSGHLINISSVAGHVVFPGGAVYCGTKFAVRAIAEGFRQEAGPSIRSTIICPGAVKSELLTHSPMPARLRRSSLPPSPAAVRNAFTQEIRRPAGRANRPWRRTAHSSVPAIWERRKC